jgi:hypothetical protein
MSVRNTPWGSGARQQPVRPFRARHRECVGRAHHAAVVVVVVAAAAAAALVYSAAPPLWAVLVPQLAVDGAKELRGACQKRPWSRRSAGLSGGRRALPTN